MSERRVIVIGSGVIGTACAYYLAKAGMPVTIVDSGPFGKGCSHGNCGLVCPGHVLPLAAPGAVANTLASMFRKASPFYVKPRVDLSLWNWFFRFALRCRKAPMMEAARARHALLGSSMSLYRQLVAQERIDCEWETRGVLFVFQHQEEFQRYEATVRLLREHFDIAIRRYDGGELVRLEPSLRPGLAGAWHYEGDAHLRPDKLLSSWRRVLEKMGVEIHEQCHVRAFLGDNRHASAVETALGPLPASACVVATGALTPLLSAHLGCRIPIQPGKGYSITMARPSKCPAIPMIFHENRVAVTPMQSGYRLGSTMEFAGYDSSLNPDRLALLKEAARKYLHEPLGHPVQEQWFGWRPMTYDGIPYIDQSPAFHNVYVAAGHNMLGVSMAPATGKLIAELITGDEPHIDLAPYRIDRR